jgi:hypothetical protein
MGMSAASEKLLRKRFLVSPSTARRLEHLAAVRGTSTSEIVRQAINAYDEKTADVMGSDELMAIVSLRLKEATKSTRHAHRAVTRTLMALERGS